MFGTRWKLVALFCVLGASAVGVSAGAFDVALGAPAFPARFVGTVAVGGTPAPPDSPVLAYVGGRLCGQTTTFDDAGETRYVVFVEAAAAVHPGCGADGVPVTFVVSGRAAPEQGAWANSGLNFVHLNIDPSSACFAGFTAQGGLCISGNSRVTTALIAKD